MKCLSTKAALRTLHYISSYFVYHIVTGICTDTCIQQVEIHISLADLSVGSVTSSLMDESTSILFLVHVFYARKNSYFTQLLSTTLFDKPILNCREDFVLGAPDLQITSPASSFRHVGYWIGRLSQSLLASGAVPRFARTSYAPTK